MVPAVKEQLKLDVMIKELALQRQHRIELANSEADRLSLEQQLQHMKNTIGNLSMQGAYQAGLTAGRVPTVPVPMFQMAPHSTTPHPSHPHSHNM